MRGYLSEDKKRIVSDLRMIYEVVQLDESGYTALTVFLNRTTCKIPKKVQVWNRRSPVDRFVLRFEVPFARIANAFRKETPHILVSEGDDLLKMMKKRKEKVRV